LLDIIKKIDEKKNYEHKTKNIILESEKNLEQFWDKKMFFEFFNLIIGIIHFVLQEKEYI
jgi:hypothetical protein